MNKEIIKIIKECANKNFAKVSKLVESEMDKAVYGAVKEDEEKLLDLDAVSEGEDEEVTTEEDTCDTDAEPQLEEEKEPLEESKEPTPEQRKTYAKLKSELQAAIKGGSSGDVQKAKAALDKFDASTKDVKFESVEDAASEEEPVVEAEDEEVKEESFEDMITELLK